MNTDDDTSQPTVLSTTADSIVWLTLNRPERANTFNGAMLDELHQALERANRDESVKVVVITGAGVNTFCMGSDLSFLKKAFASREFSLFRSYLIRLNELLFFIEHLAVPVIAMIQGKARAAGFEMMLACDFVFVAEEAVVGDVHTPFGHIPGAGATYRLTWKIGVQRALAILMTGQWLTGAAMAECGLAMRAVPRAQLRTEVEAFVSELTNKTRESLMHIKRCAIRSRDIPANSAVELEWKTYIEYLSTSTEPITQFQENQRLRHLKS